MPTKCAPRTSAATVLLGVLLSGISLPLEAQSEILMEKATNGQDADAAPGPALVVGDPVTWTYEVTNIGSRTLTSISVTDDVEGAVPCPGTTLGPGESMTCTVSGTVQSGQYANVGTATGELPNATQVQDTDPSHYLGQSEPSIDLEKATEGVNADTAPGPVLPVGSTVTWTYRVTNIGTETLSNIQVTDDQEGSITCPDTTLEVGASMTCTVSGTVEPGQYANTASVTATLPDTTQVADTDPSHHFGQALVLDKLTNGEDADLPPGPVLGEGDAVTWTYEVSNPGPETVTNLAVADDQGVVVSCPQTTLAPRESVTCTGSGTAGFGQYANVGTATVELPSGGVVSASDPSHYTGPVLEIQKSTNGDDADTPPGPTLIEGDPVTWTYVVTNHGNEEITDVSVVDDQGVSVTCPGTSLAGGSSMTCTGAGTVQLGQYANVGSVAAVHPTLGAIGGSDPSHYFGEARMPDVSASKAVELTDDLNGDGATGPGDTLTYTVILVNSGTGDATGVVFTDTPDANTSLLAGSVATTQGTVTTGNSAGDTAVEVAVGTLAAGGGTATLTFQVEVDPALSGGVTEIVNQGVVSGDGFSDVATDDPAEPGAADPTVVAVRISVLEIPTLGTWGALVLLTLLAGLGVARLGGR